MGILISEFVEIIVSPPQEVDFGSRGRACRLIVQLPLIINGNFSVRKMGKKKIPLFPTVIVVVRYGLDFDCFVTPTGPGNGAVFVGILINAFVEIIVSPPQEVELGSRGRARRLMVQFPLIINGNFSASKMSRKNSVDCQR